MFQNDKCQKSILQDESWRQGTKHEIMNRKVSISLSLNCNDTRFSNGQSVLSRVDLHCTRGWLLSIIEYWALQREIIIKRRGIPPSLIRSSEFIDLLREAGRSVNEDYAICITAGRGAEERREIAPWARQLRVYVAVHHSRHVTERVCAESKREQRRWGVRYVMSPRGLQHMLMSIIFVHVASLTFARFFVHMFVFLWVWTALNLG